MITIQICLQDQTIARAIAEAGKQGLSLDDYIDMRLGSDDGSALGDATVPTALDTIEELARKLFDAALERPLEGDESEKSDKYLVEELYKQLDLSEWDTRSVGNRIRLGKAFKRLVLLQLEGGTQLEDGIQVKVEPCGKTVQNQALYRTVRVG